MNKTLLITGASSGIGAACVKQAAQLSLNIIATARNQSKLQQLANDNKSVQIIIADIATQAGRSHIAQSIKQPIDFLLHNAATLDKPQPFNDLTLDDFRKNIATNVEPIIFLTQKLIPNLKAALNSPRILSMSSGVAKQAIAGLGNYCISKAAALMANQILKVECEKQCGKKGILVNDYFPGVVDTPMQKTLRSSSTEIFPYSDEFKKMKSDKQLNNPNCVAKHLLEVFTTSSDEEFSQSEWVFKAHNVLDK
ncbi:MAG: SDR family NAD(P)-dependent oxidoreductase [Proteobacteria bacterium]|nr:SDR family NAD(P)-dependent oxidoreductase [Pseudomonadota bacterium]